MSRSSYGRGRDGERNNSQNHENGPSSTFSIFIQSEDCGKLIGKAGAKLRELQDESQTQIKVSRNLESDGTRKVDIVGRPDNITMAQQLIENILNTSGGPGDHSNPKQNSIFKSSKNRENFPQNSSSIQVCNEEENWNVELNENFGSGRSSSQVFRHENIDADHNDPWNDRFSQPVANNGGQYSARADNGDWDENNEWDQPVTATFTRSGGNRSRACHNCGQEGHLVRECPQNGGGGGGRGSSRFGACYKCGQEGHLARDCSQSGGGGGGGGNPRSGTCYKCGQEGHMARDCSQPASSGRREGGRACNKCGSEDHLARDCSSQSSRTGFRGRGGSNSSDWRKEADATDPNQCRDVITVHNEQIGRLIGRQGSKIKELMEDSNCKIKVANCEGEFGEVEVTLSGSKEDIIKAKKLIFRAGVSFSGGSKEFEEKKEEVKEFVKIDWNAFRANMAKSEEERFKDLPPIEKEFYIEADHIKNLHPEDVCQFRLESNNIMVDNPDCREVNIPNPVITFEDAFEHYPLILEQIYKQGFTRPSPVQCQSWPILLSGLDLIGIAQTGTGKTLAFLLPAMIHIDSQPIPRPERTGPTCLVLCPTRELALQIQEEVNKINYKGIKSVCVYGGGNRREQVQAVKKGVEIVVATPGRLNDLIMSEIICVKSVTYLVLDEADRMLDMGFEPDIRKVLLDIRPDRQTVMTSATWPADVQRLANQYLRRPIHVHVGTLDLAAVHSVKQEVVFMEDDRKKEYLFDFIHDMGPDDKLIVFVGKKVKADDISSDLALRDMMCQCIHGDREQCDREQALEEFKSGFVRILVATDVASRGLDVKDITHVLNYDFPRNIEEYVHRIGRTGRAGRTGTAITLLTRGDWRSAQQLIDIMAEAQQEVPQELMDMAQRFRARQERDEREGRGGRRGGGRGGGGFRGSGRQDDRNFYEKLMGGGKRRGYKDPLDAFMD